MGETLGPVPDGESRRRALRECLGRNLEGRPEAAKAVARHWRAYRGRLGDPELGRLALALAALAGLPDEFAPERDVLLDTALRWADLEAERRLASPQHGIATR